MSSGNKQKAAFVLVMELVWFDHRGFDVALTYVVRSPVLATAGN